MKLLKELSTILPLTNRISGLGSLSQLIRLWSVSYYRCSLNRKSYFADIVSTIKKIAHRFFLRSQGLMTP